MNIKKLIQDQFGSKTIIWTEEYGGPILELNGQRYEAKIFAVTKPVVSNIRGQFRIRYFEIGETIFVYASDMLFSVEAKDELTV